MAKKSVSKRPQPVHTPTPSTMPEACTINVIIRMVENIKQERRQIARIRTVLFTQRKCVEIAISIRTLKRTNIHNYKLKNISQIYIFKNHILIPLV